MEIAIWIIAICEIVRIVQNSLQLVKLFNNSNDKFMKTATDEFVRSLNKTDKDFINDILKKIEEENNG